MGFTNHLLIQHQIQVFQTVEPTPIGFHRFIWKNMNMELLIMSKRMIAQCQGLLPLGSLNLRFIHFASKRHIKVLSGNDKSLRFIFSKLLLSKHKASTQFTRIWFKQLISIFLLILDQYIEKINKIGLPLGLSQSFITLL